MLRHAIDAKLKIDIDYVAESESRTQRTLQPLGQMFWGKVWTLVAWCELRDDYRHFRLDRIKKLSILDQQFETNKTKSLEHFITLYSPKD